MSDARGKILERRARFLAAAVATVGIGTASCKPQPCLSQVAPQTDATSMPDDVAPEEPPPAPCLSVAYPEESGAEPDALTAASPMPCLSQTPPPQDAGPKPQPCLKVSK